MKFLIATKGIAINADKITTIHIRAKDKATGKLVTDAFGNECMAVKTQLDVVAMVHGVDIVLRECDSLKMAKRIRALILEYLCEPKTEVALEVGSL